MQPSAYRLWPAFPNPFNPITTIAFSIPVRQKVILKIFDAAGREVATLKEGELEPGRHDVLWQAAGMPSGLYFCRIASGPFTKAQKILLLK
jgi:hypothetical protein